MWVLLECLYMVAFPPSPRTHATRTHFNLDVTVMRLSEVHRTAPVVAVVQQQRGVQAKCRYVWVRDVCRVRERCSQLKYLRG